MLIHYVFLCKKDREENLDRTRPDILKTTLYDITKPFFIILNNLSVNDDRFAHTFCRKYLLNELYSLPMTEEKFIRWCSGLASKCFIKVAVLCISNFTFGLSNLYKTKKLRHLFQNQHILRTYYIKICFLIDIVKLNLASLTIFSLP